METIDIFKLKSGTDIRGTASEGVDQITLTDDVVSRISKAFGQFVKDTYHKEVVTIAIGHDSRVSAERLKNCVSKALMSTQCNVVSVGLCSTPSMFMITKDTTLNVDGSIMLTASHHPSHKNGLKFFVKEGGLEGKDITTILNLADENNFCDKPFGCEISCNYIDMYCQILVDKVIQGVGRERPLEGFKIVVDAGNGAGGFYADKVLKPLGADTDGSQFLEPDGTFPNHIPNPENTQAMEAISSCVLKNKADLGVIFDTDVDRAAVVSSDGEEINRNKLIALISKILLDEKKPATMVTDSITSSQLNQFIVKEGGEHHRFKRGYKNVINEAIRLNLEGVYAPLAIETSGHAALMENFFLDDGAYLVTRLIIQMAKMKGSGQTLVDLICDLKMPKEESEIRMGFFTEDFKEYGLNVLSEFKKFAEKTSGLSLETPNFEGVRVNFDKENGDGWALLRMSLHDPIMPLNIESNSTGGVKIIAKKILEFIKEHELVNFENLTKFIEK